MYKQNEPVSYIKGERHYNKTYNAESWMAQSDGSQKIHYNSWWGNRRIASDPF